MENTQQNVNNDLTKRFSAEELGLLAVAVGLDRKALRPVLMDLRAQGGFTEYFAIISASNARQVGALADAIKVFFKTALGLAPLAIDGTETLTWVLMDYGSVFVHIFQEPTREMYQLEQLWSKSRIIPLSEEIVQPLYNEAKALLPQIHAETEE